MIGQVAAIMWLPSFKFTFKITENPLYKWGTIPEDVEGQTYVVTTNVHKQSWTANGVLFIFQGVLMWS